MRKLIKRVEFMSFKKAFEKNLLTQALFSIKNFISDFSLNKNVFLEFHVLCDTSVCRITNEENPRRKQLLVYHFHHSKHDEWFTTYLDHVELFLQRREYADTAIKDLQHIHHQSDVNHWFGENIQVRI